VLLTFNHAGTGDEKELRTTDDDVLDGEGHGGIIRSRGFKVSRFQSFKVKSKDKAIVIGRSTASHVNRAKAARRTWGIRHPLPRYPRKGSAAKVDTRAGAARRQAGSVS
jgi:hypothetical protein